MGDLVPGPSRRVFQVGIDIASSGSDATPCTPHAGSSHPRGRGLSSPPGSPRLRRCGLAPCENRRMSDYPRRPRAGTIQRMRQRSLTPSVSRRHGHSLLALSLSLGGCSDGDVETARPEIIQEDKEPFRSLFSVVDLDGREPIVGIHDEILCDNPEARLRFALWADGRAVWSKSPSGAGAPYSCARLENGDLSFLVERVSRRLASADMSSLSDRRISGWHRVVRMRLDGADLGIICYWPSRDGDGRTSLAREAWSGIWEIVCSVILGTGEETARDQFRFVLFSD